MKSDLFAGEHLAGAADFPGMTLRNAEAVTYPVNGERGGQGFVVVRPSELTPQKNSSR